MFPPELEEEIISHLWDDKKTLGACALTCRSFQFPSQKFLYCKIILERPGRRSSMKSTAALEAIIDANPRLRQYVQRVEVLDEFRRWLMRDESIGRLLLMFDNLQALVIKYGHPTPYEENHTIWPDSILSALLRVIHLPSLKHLSITDFPVELMKHGQHLTHLSLWRPTSQALEVGSCIRCESCDRRLKLLSLDLQQPPCSEDGDYIRLLQEALDMKQIGRLYADASETRNGHRSLCPILENCAGALSALAFIPCESMRSFYREPSAYKDFIQWNAFKSLRVLAVKLDFTSGYAYLEYESPQSWEHFHTFSWFFATLYELSSSSSCLEHIYIQLFLDFGPQDPEWNKELRIWVDICALLADKGRFPRLRNVEIKVKATDVGNLSLPVLGSAADNFMYYLERGGLERLTKRSDPELIVEWYKDNSDWDPWGAIFS